MSSKGNRTGASDLNEQRLTLCEQIRQRRHAIIDSLTHAPSDNTSFPRSATMQFIVRQPGAVALLSAVSAKLFFGINLSHSLPTTFAVSRYFQSIFPSTKGSQS